MGLGAGGEASAEELEDEDGRAESGTVGDAARVVGGRGVVGGLARWIPRAGEQLALR